MKAGIKKITAEVNTLMGERETMFIYDDEIKIRCPDYERVIADLDADPRTQKGKATRPAEARFKPAVEDYLRLRAERNT